MNVIKRSIVGMALVSALLTVQRDAWASDGQVLPQQAKAQSVSVLSPEEAITPEELKGLMDTRADLIVFDARARRSYNAGHIQGAVLPLGDEFYRQHELFEQKIISTAPDRARALAEAVKEVPKDKPIVTYCNKDCSASVSLLLELKRLGFTRVQAMEAGFQAWEEKGYPTASN
jgi:rhodanese-related sulfurtransferase